MGHFFCLLARLICRPPPPTKVIIIKRSLKRSLTQAGVRHLRRLNTKKKWSRKRCCRFLLCSIYFCSQSSAWDNSPPKFRKQLSKRASFWKWLSKRAISALFFFFSVQDIIILASLGKYTDKEGMTREGCQHAGIFIGLVFDFRGSYWNVKNTWNLFFLVTYCRCHSSHV